MKFVFHILMMAVAGMVFLAACSGLKTREDVVEDQKAAAAQEAEETGPIDDEAINDGLAEMGVDPNQGQPEVANEVEKSEPTPEPIVAPPPQPVVSKPVAKKAAPKKVVKKKVTKKKKAVKK